MDASKNYRRNQLLLRQIPYSTIRSDLQKQRSAEHRCARMLRWRRLRPEKSAYRWRRDRPAQSRETKGNSPCGTSARVAPKVQELDIAEHRPEGPKSIGNFFPTYGSLTVSSHTRSEFSFPTQQLPPLTVPRMLRILGSQVRPSPR